MTPLYAAVLVGAAQNVFSKSAKYSLFDPCKEMAYIPLDKETQVPSAILFGFCPLSTHIPKRPDCIVACDKVMLTSQESH